MKSERFAFKAKTLRGTDMHKRIIHKFNASVEDIVLYRGTYQSLKLVGSEICSFRSCSGSRWWFQTFSYKNATTFNVPKTIWDVPNKTPPSLSFSFPSSIVQTSHRTPDREKKKKVRFWIQTSQNQTTQTNPHLLAGLQRSASAQRAQIRGNTITICYYGSQLQLLETNRGLAVTVWRSVTAL